MLPAMRRRFPVHNPGQLRSLLRAQPHPVSLPAFRFHGLPPSARSARPSPPCSRAYATTPRNGRPKLAADVRLTCCLYTKTYYIWATMQASPTGMVGKRNSPNQQRRDTRAEPLIRENLLSRLALAPENVRKTPPDPQADAELKASIAALGLLESLVDRIDGPGEDFGSGPGQVDTERYAVVAGGRRLEAMQALVEDEVFDPDHPVPCLVKSSDVEPGEISLAEKISPHRDASRRPGRRVREAHRGRPVRRRHRIAFRHVGTAGRAAAPPRQRRPGTAGGISEQRDRPRSAEGVRRHHRPQAPDGGLGSRSRPRATARLPSR